MSQQPVDAHVRARALATDQSFICVAPAGSGKTELLTQRVLVLLARVQKPEEILAITFTRKAAAEMQHRVMGALRMALGPEPQEPHKKQTWVLANAALKADSHLGWNLLNSPHRLQVKTFDGLCASLVKALPLQAQMGAGVALSDDPNRLYKKAANNLLAELERPDPIGDALAGLLMHLDNRQQQVVELFMALLKSRAAWLPLVMAPDGRVREHLEACLVHVRQAHIERLQHLIPQNLATTLLGLVTFAAGNMPASSAIGLSRHLMALPKSDDLGIQQWCGIAELLLTKTGDWRKSVTKNQGIPAKVEGLPAKELKAIKANLTALIDALSHSETLRQCLAEVAQLPYRQYPEPQWQMLESLTLLLPRLVAHLQVVFASDSELDFTEMSLRADRALGAEDEPTDLALRMDHRVSHVLVDEFQDTSSNQMQLVQKLTAGWQAGDGRTFFCVGDAMQSIYAFRSANVGLFLRCLGRDHQGANLGAIPLEPLALNTNFRSEAGIVEWINHAFSHAFPHAVDLNLGAVPYNKAVPFNPQNGQAVTVKAFAGEGATLAEGPWLAAQIQQILTAAPNATISILGRSRRNLHSVLPALKTHGIRYRAVDLDPLSSVPAVQDAWVLTRALLNTSDTIAWLSLLRAPWCGLTLADLLAIRQLPSSNVVSQIEAALYRQQQGQLILSQDGFARLKPSFVVLNASLQNRARKRLADWVKSAWLALAGAATLTPADKLNVERYFDALAECNSTQLLQQPERLSALIDELYALPDPEASAQIQVMTMHKSKGLEFDHVFLVGLASSGGKQESPLMRWHEQLFEQNAASNFDAASTWLLSPVGERGQDKDELYQWLGLQQRKREKLEACRLLYVACTRAKKRLYLSAVLSQKQGDAGQGNESIKAPPSGSLLEHIWSTMANAFTLKCECIEPQFSEPSEGATAQSILNRLSLIDLDHFNSNLNSSLQSTIEAAPANTILVDNPELMASGAPLNGTPSQDGVELSNDAKAVGSLVHEVLEAWVTRKDLTQVTANPINWSPYYGLWQTCLIQLGVLNNADNVIEQVVTQLNKVLSVNSPLINALKNAIECFPEYAISVDNDNFAKQWRIDLWWRGADGRVWLVDYKTAKWDPTVELSVFEASQLHQYQSTLIHYAKLLSELLNEPVTPVLYLTDTSSWLVLDDSAYG